MPAPLAHRVAEDADAAQIARAVVATWQAIDAALAPIIGTQGVAALYKRSLSLTAALHPWLADMPAGVQATMNLEALEAVFAQQGSGDAVVGGNALLQTFHQLLGSLVGPSLTERLLRSVWAADSSHGAPAQDTTP
jgi:hypothetical protein